MACRFEKQCECALNIFIIIPSFALWLHCKKGLWFELAGWLKHVRHAVGVFNLYPCGLFYWVLWPHPTVHRHTCKVSW